MSPHTTTSLFDMRDDEVVEQILASMEEDVEDEIQIIEQFSSEDLGRKELRQAQQRRQHQPKQPQQAKSNYQLRLPDIHLPDISIDVPNPTANMVSPSALAASFFSKMKAIETHNKEKLKKALKTSRSTREAKAGSKMDEQEEDKEEHTNKKVQFAPPSDNVILPESEYETEEENEQVEEEKENAWIDYHEVDESMRHKNGMLLVSDVEEFDDGHLERLLLGEEYNTVCSDFRPSTDVGQPHSEKCAQKARKAVLNVQEFTEKTAIRIEANEDDDQEKDRWEMIADVYQVCSRPSIRAAHEKALRVFEDIQNSSSPEGLAAFPEGFFQTSPTSVAAVATAQSFPAGKGAPVPEEFIEEGIVAFS